MPSHRRRAAIESPSATHTADGAVLNRGVGNAATRRTAEAAERTPTPAGWSPLASSTGLDGDELGRELALDQVAAIQTVTVDGALLREGSAGPAVRELQALLGRERPTGSFDATTTTLLEQFQASRELTVDGVAGPSTLRALLRHSADQDLTGGRVYEQGAAGPTVMGIQQALGMRGAAQDGDYGPATAQAVRDFQSRNGLTASGQVGPHTWEALRDRGDLPGAYLGLYDAYQAGQEIGQIEVVELDGKKVAARTADAWITLQSAAARDGVELRLSSGFRTQAEQQELHRMYRAGTGNLAATPGYSNHQNGRALDIDVSRADTHRWTHDHAPGLGWERTVPSEAWHWEYSDS